MEYTILRTVYGDRYETAMTDDGLYIGLTCCHGSREYTLFLQSCEEYDALIADLEQHLIDVRALPPWAGKDERATASTIYIFCTPFILDEDVTRDVIAMLQAASPHRSRRSHAC